MNRLKNLVNIQEYAKNRITVSDSVLSVSMNPLDGDGNTSYGRQSGRQRNEVSVIAPACVCRRGNSIEYKADVKLPAGMNRYIDDVEWYHVFQIKLLSVNRPLITMGLKNNKLVLYRYDSYNAIVIGDVKDNLESWININVNVYITSTRVIVDYDTNGKTGKITYKTSSSKNNYVYMKLGQYRSYPNSIKRTLTTYYKSVTCN